MRQHLYFFLLFMLTSTIHNIDAMMFEPLTNIEQALIVHQIKQYGVKTIIDEINKSRPIKRINETCYEVPIVLHIQSMFFKVDMENDPLVKMIFDKINMIEAKFGYNPQGDLGSGMTLPTNFLGRDTRYYWLDDHNTIFSAVRIDARLHNRTEIDQTIDNYRKMAN